MDLTVTSYSLIFIAFISNVVVIFSTNIWIVLFLQLLHLDAKVPTQSIAVYGQKLLHCGEFMYI